MNISLEVKLFCLDSLMGYVFPLLLHQILSSHFISQFIMSLACLQWYICLVFILLSVSPLIFSLYICVLEALGLTAYASYVFFS